MDIMNKPKIEKTVYLKLAYSEKNNKNKKKEKLF